MSLNPDLPSLPTAIWMSCFEYDGIIGSTTKSGLLKAALLDRSQAAKRIAFQSNFQSKRHRYVMLNYAIISYTAGLCGRLA